MKLKTFILASLAYMLIGTIVMYLLTVLIIEFFNWVLHLTF